MLFSLEALAMAGASHVENAIDVEEWEQRDLEQTPPPHLLVDEEEEEESVGKTRFTNCVYGLPTTQFLSKGGARGDNGKEHTVTFTNYQYEKMDRIMERRTPQCMRSIKRMVISVIALCRL